MPYSYSVNQAVTSLTGTFSAMLTFMQAHGWVYVASSANIGSGTVTDTMVYKPDAPVSANGGVGQQPDSFGHQVPYWSNPPNNTTDPLVIGRTPPGNPVYVDDTIATTCHGSLAMMLSWFIIKQPGPIARMFLFQRDNTVKFSATPNLDTSWRIKYSPGGLFTGTVAGGDTCPHASDEVFLLGGGTDAAPTFSSILTAVTVGSGGKLHMMAGDGSENYAFCAFVTLTTTPTAPDSDAHIRFIFAVDPVRGAPVGDTDPAIFYVDGNAPQSMRQNLTNSVTHSPIAKIGTQYVQVLAQTVSNCFPALLPVDPLNAKEPLTPVLWARGTGGPSAPNGFKGYSTMMLWKGFDRLFYDTNNVASSKDRIIMGYVSLPWSGVDIDHTAGGNADAEVLFPVTSATGKKFFLAAHDSASPPHRVYWASDSVDLGQAPTPPTPPLVAGTLTIQSIL